MKDTLKRLAGSVCAAGMLLCPFGGMLPLTASATSIYGDVDNSGFVELADAVHLSRYLAGKVLTSNVNLQYSDVDKNTVLDVNDVQIITRYISGTINYLPYSQTGTFVNSSNATLTVPTDHYRGYIKHDCTTGQNSSYHLSQPTALNSSLPQTREGIIDDRIPDSSVNAQSIVHLNYHKSNGHSYTASGFIVGDHVIATCGHSLFEGNNVFCTNMTVSVYNSSGTTSLASFSAKELHIPSHYYSNYDPGIDKYDRNYDYGLIYVEEDLSQYGIISLGLPTDQFINTAQTVSISGFPGEVNGISVPTGRYYASGCVKSNSTESLLNTTAYSSEGDSGGPIYMDYTLSGQSFRSVVGICDYYYSNKNQQPTETYRYSGGVRMTLPVLRFFLNNPNIGS